MKGSKHLLKKIKSNLLLNERIIIGIVIILLGGLLFAGILFASQSNNYILLAGLGIIVLSLFAFLLLSQGEVASALEKIASSRAQVCSVFLFAIFGSVISVFITVQANQISSEQTDIANRETPPYLTIAAQSNNEGRDYTITSKKGLALYSSLVVTESYYFAVNGKGHEVNFSFEGQVLNGNTNLDPENQTATFRVYSYGFNPDHVKNLVYNTVLKETGIAPILSHEKEISFHFFDYQNKSTTFLYSEGDDGITLSTTDSPFDSSPKRNTTFLIFPNESIDDLVESGVQHVLTMDPYTNEFDY